MPLYNYFCFYWWWIFWWLWYWGRLSNVEEQVGKVNILAVWKSMQINPFGEDYTRPNFPNMFRKTSLIMITMVIKMMIGNHKSLRHGDDQPMVAANSSRQLARCRTSTGAGWVEKQGGNLSSSRKQGFILGTRIFEKQKNKNLWRRKNTKQESLTLHSQCFSLKNSAKLIRRMQKNCIHNALVWNCHHNVAPLRDFHASKWV